jgi:predicted amidohydrolase
MPNNTDRILHVAAVQMDVHPAQTDLRLYRADQIIQDAVQLGAELVVLPELFNTGYAYLDQNFQHAEPIDGATVTWMKRTAHRMGVHLAGTLLLTDEGEIYNAMLIIAPDGRTWRYDKSYPWGWERGYFRENRLKGPARATIAKTELGDLGMLVCWDIAHLELWQAYAGQIDMMVVCSCPPEIPDPVFHLPPNVDLDSQALGGLWSAHKAEGRAVFGAMLDEQAHWLGVPAAQSVACGDFESPVPNGGAFLLGMMLSAPGLARYLPGSAKLSVRANMIDACRIVSGEGKLLAQRAQSRGEGFTIAEVAVPENRPRPSTPQPASRSSKLASFLSDTYLPRSVRATYEKGIQRIRAGNK